MSTLFDHGDSKITTGMRCAIAIMQVHFPKGLPAASTQSAAGMLMEHVHHPTKLGCSEPKRRAKMQSSVEVAIGRGLLRFSGNNCLLEVTAEGNKAIKVHRTGRAKHTQRYVNKPVAA